MNILKSIGCACIGCIIAIVLVLHCFNTTVTNLDETQIITEDSFFKQKEFDYEEYTEVLKSKNPVRINDYITSVKQVTGYVDSFIESITLGNGLWLKIEGTDMHFQLYLYDDDLRKIDIGDTVTLSVSLKKADRDGWSNYMHASGKCRLVNLIKSELIFCVCGKN